MPAVTELATQVMGFVLVVVSLLPCGVSLALLVVSLAIATFGLASMSLMTPVLSFLPAIMKFTTRILKRMTARFSRPSEPSTETQRGTFALIESTLDCLAKNRPVQPGKSCWSERPSR